MAAAWRKWRRELSLAVLFAGILGHFAARHRHSCRPGGRAGLPFSPAFLILWVPAGFRFTCYYYRGAYYKAFWADPINCAVGEPRKTFLGERYFPLIIQNIHRYFFYLAALFIVLLSYDAWLGMWFTDATGKEHFGIGVGTIVLTLERRFPRRCTLLAAIRCGI